MDRLQEQPEDADEPQAKYRRCSEPTSDTGPTNDSSTDAVSECTSYEEFRSTLGYFFTLFQKLFPSHLEKSTKDQFEALQEGDVIVRDDGGNNPEVSMRLDPLYMAQLCDALEDQDGTLPSIKVPRTPDQVSFWQGQLAKAADAPLQRAAASSLEADHLSESESHWETIREALAWHVSAAGNDVALKEVSQPLKVFILGASARYEYGGLKGDGSFSSFESADQLLKNIISIVKEVAQGRDAKFVLCGRDVPADLNGFEQKGISVPGQSTSNVVVKHHVGYLHNLPVDEAGEDCLRGALFVALHGGLGLEHPELAVSWPPTLQKIRSAAPVHVAISSFNKVEHDIAADKLRTSFPQQLEEVKSGVNPVGSLYGPDTIGPFDGLQGKRNYCVLHARVLPLKLSSDGWDLFD